MAKGEARPTCLLPSRERRVEGSGITVNPLGHQVKFQSEPCGAAVCDRHPLRGARRRTMSGSMTQFAWVAIGGAAGAVARHALGLGVARLWPGLGWPVATLAVNVLGGLAMGLLIGWLDQAGGDERLRLLLGVGLLGGFTTFSAFSLETVQLIERRDGLAAGLYVALSVVLSVAAVMLGLWLMRRLAA